MNESCLVMGPPNVGRNGQSATLHILGTLNGVAFGTLHTGLLKLIIHVVQCNLLRQPRECWRY